MMTEEVRAPVTTALADPTVDLAAPLGMSLMLREGLHATVLAGFSRGDHQTSVGDGPGSLNYHDGDQVRVGSLSPESELLLSAYLA
jgi:hypothetical protein